jgi:outer membrane protein OmpU
MKKVLFASTALAALAVGGVASAQGIALFGTARLGLGYNIGNDGQVDGDEDLRAVSRVRFGVNMTGETDSGITFGATIRADNAINGDGDPADGQTAGDVFVSGDWGTLTFGDTNAADEQWVGDVPGNLSLTQFDEVHETLFISNGGGAGDDNSDFASNPEARPTVRYDIDIAGFGLSLSSNRSLDDVGVGAGYSADFAGGSWTVGLGYYNFSEFDIVDAEEFEIATLDDGTEVLVPGDLVTTTVEGGEQYSVGLNAEFESFGFGATYTMAKGDEEEFDSLAIGGTFGWDAFTVGAWYHTIVSADGDVEGLDGDTAYALTAEYDLGGGASVNGGVGQVDGAAFGGIDDDNQTVADFGIKMAF